MRKLKGMKVKEVMTSEVFLAEIPGHRNDALSIMKDKNISGLPVVEKGSNKFVGIITRHDIYDKPDREQIAMLYKENVASISPNSSIETLVKRFLETKQYWIPVVEKGKIVGIVTPADLLFIMEELDKRRSVIDFMGRHNCVPIYRKSPIAVALHILRITHIPALPVLDAKVRLVGIVSDMDIFKILISEKTRRNIELNVEDDIWTWEGIRNFNQIYAMPNMRLPDIKVENVMVKKVKYLYPHSNVASAAKTMRVNNIGQLPVCGKGDILVGMVYNYNLLSMLLHGN